MYTAHIVNIKDGREWGPVPFDTLELANSWISKQKLLQGRRPIRTVIASTVLFDEDDVLAEDTEVIHGESIRFVTLKAEATWTVTDISKTVAITDSYKTMNTEVYTQMAITFGTTNPESATAYERTWSMMKETPSDWTSAGLKDDQGNALDTSQKITDYATAKLALVKAYGIWRMSRIQQFKNDRAAILAS